VDKKIEWLECLRGLAVLMVFAAHVPVFVGLPQTLHGHGVGRADDRDRPVELLHPLDSHDRPLQSYSSALAADGGGRARPAQS
jgi:hypothetical protein